MFAVIKLVVILVVLAAIGVVGTTTTKGLNPFFGFLLFVPLALLALVAYFVPSIVAAHREHAQRGAITALNFFLGWSFVGWVVALVWSMSNPQVVASRPAGTTDSYMEPIEPRFGPVSREPVPGAEKVCPRCAESVKAAALVCRYCGHEFGAQPS